MTSGDTLDTTVDEWRAEMEKSETGEPGLTVRELMEKLGLKRTTMQERLGKLIKAGRCTRGRGKRIGVGGTYPVAVYQLIPETKAGK